MQTQTRIVAATAVMNSFDQILIGGRSKTSINGADQYYPQVRNIVISSGRFLDHSDVALAREGRACSPIISPSAVRLTRAAALNQTIKLYGLQFIVVGTFHEKVETFGQFGGWSATRS